MITLTIDQPPAAKDPERRELRPAALALAMLLLLFVGCAHGPLPGGSEGVERPAHHGPEGFRNRGEAIEDKGLLTLLKWRWQAWRTQLPPPPQAPVPQQAPDLVFLQHNARAGAAMQSAVTWIGHASMLVQVAGLNLLLDPMFSDRASPLSWIGPKRAQAPALTPATLPRIDAVLISHNHYDHLDLPSLQALARQPGGPPRWIVPLGVSRLLVDAALPGAEHSIELHWWQETALPGAAGPVAVALTPAQHWSRRGLSDRNRTLWGGFALFAPELHLLYTGDTGYSDDFRAIRARYAERQTPARGGGFDLALIPIGAYELRWFMRAQHVNPEEAVQIHLDLGARQSVGVHWGSFEMSFEPLDQPPRDLALARRARGLADEAFRTLAIGETLRLPRRPLAQ